MSGDLIQVITTLITVLGGLGTVYIVKVIAKRRKENLPKDRMETIFDGYEKLIAQQQLEIDRKGAVIGSLENVVRRLEEELGNTRELLKQARTELSTAREQNEKLKTQLSKMRAEYKSDVDKWRP